MDEYEREHSAADGAQQPPVADAADALKATPAAEHNGSVPGPLTGCRRSRQPGGVGRFNRRAAPHARCGDGVLEEHGRRGDAHG